MPRVLNLGPQALFSRVTVTDLLVFEGVYEAWLNGKGLRKELRKFGGASEKMWKLIFERLASSLGCANGRQLMARCRKEGVRSPGHVLHKGIKSILRQLRDLVEEAKERSKRVVIDGSEFGISWLLPRVLAGSRWLETHVGNELEISQSSWQHYLGRLESGEADLCLGTHCDHGPSLQSEVVLTLPRWLIYPKKGAFQPPSDGLKSLDSLRYATVFALAGDVSPSLAKVYELLPRPEPPGRRIYVQSVALMYLYARQGLGVAIGYDPIFGISDAKESPLAAVPILDGKVKPAQITVYRRAQAELSEAAESLGKAIRAVSAQIQTKQRQLF